MIWTHSKRTKETYETNHKWILVRDIVFVFEKLQLENKNKRKDALRKVVQILYILDINKVLKVIEIDISNHIGEKTENENVQLRRGFITC